MEPAGMSGCCHVLPDQAASLTHLAITAYNPGKRSHYLQVAVLQVTHLAHAQTGCQNGGVPAACALGQRRTLSPGCYGSLAPLRGAGGPPPALSPAGGCLCALHLNQMLALSS